MKTTLSREELTSIINYMQYKKAKWISDEVLELKKSDIQITLDSTGTKDVTDPVDISYNEKSKALAENIIKWAKQKIPTDYVSLFTPYTIFSKNFVLLDEFETFFKSAKINKVIFNGSLTKHSTSSDELILYICPSAPNSLSSDIKLKKYSKMNGFEKPTITNNYIEPIYDEHIKDIVIDGETIGKYYVDRNIIILFVNIFNPQIHFLFSISDNEYIDTFLKDLKSAFKTVSVKVCKSDMALKIMADTFLKGIDKSISTKTSEIDSTTRKIDDCEKNLPKLYNTRKILMEEIHGLNISKNNLHKNLLSNIEKAKAHPIVDSIKFDNGTIYFKFIETTIDTKLDRNIEGKPIGEQVTMYVGSVTFEVDSSFNIRVTCTHPALNGNAHPHASGTSPCLGTEETSRLLRSYVGEMEFEKAIYLMWMWIKTFKPNQAHMKAYSYMDDRLSQGLPVFDKDDNPITINDKKLITSGLLSKIDKAENYNDNIKKFAGYKVVRS